MASLKEAIESAQGGYFTEALEIYGQLVSEGKVHVDALGHRAWLLKSLGRYEEALADYETLTTLSPQNRPVQHQKWDTICRMGRAEEAISGLLEMLRTDPFDQEAVKFLSAFQDTRNFPDHQPKAEMPSGEIQPVAAVNSVIQAIEQDLSSYPATAFPEIGRMLYTLVKLIRPGLTVETGCFIGYSTLCMAQALEEVGSGHIHSFDLFPADQPVESPVLGHCRNRLEASRGHIEHAALSHRITLHQGDSSSNISALMGTLKEQPSIDLAFLDGDHTTEGCKKDFFAVDPHLKPGGLILLHDTIPQYCGWAGPRQLMDDLATKSQGQYQVINFPSPEGFGLGLLQKTGGGAVAPWRKTFTQTLTDILYEYTHRRHLRV